MWDQPYLPIEYINDCLLECDSVYFVRYILKKPVSFIWQMAVYQGVRIPQCNNDHSHRYWEPKFLQVDLSFTFVYCSFCRKLWLKSVSIQRPESLFVVPILHQESQHQKGNGSCTLLLKAQMNWQCQKQRLKLHGWSKRSCWNCRAQLTISWTRHATRLCSDSVFRVPAASDYVTCLWTVCRNELYHIRK